MRTNTQRLLNECSAFVACLGRETRIDSDHLMSSTGSLGFKNSEKRALTGVHDALRKMMVFHHIADCQVFNSNMVILNSNVFMVLVISN